MLLKKLKFSPKQAFLIPIIGILFYIGIANIIQTILVYSTLNPENIEESVRILFFMWSNILASIFIGSALILFFKFIYKKIR